MAVTMKLPSLPDRLLMRGAAETRRALQVCDDLETLADALPDQNANLWRATQRACEVILRPHFQFLSETMFPTLLVRAGEEADRKAVLLRLKSDCSDQLHALDDLDHLMTDVLMGAQFANAPDALGYALRGYFDPLRRDLTWESDVLWPLAARIVLDVDMPQIEVILGPNGVKTVSAPYHKQS